MARGGRVLRSPDASCHAQLEARCWRPGAPLDTSTCSGDVFQQQRLDLYLNAHGGDEVVKRKTWVSPCGHRSNTLMSPCTRCSAGVTCSPLEAVSRCGDQAVKNTFVHLPLEREVQVRRRAASAPPVDKGRALLVPFAGDSSGSRALPKADGPCLRFNSPEVGVSLTQTLSSQHGHEFAKAPREAAVKCMPSSVGAGDGCNRDCHGDAESTSRWSWCDSEGRSWITESTCTPAGSPAPSVSGGTRRSTSSALLATPSDLIALIEQECQDFLTIRRCFVQALQHPKPEDSEMGVIRFLLVAADEIPQKQLINRCGWVLDIKRLVHQLLVGRGCHAVMRNEHLYAPLGGGADGDEIIRVELGGPRPEKRWAWNRSSKRQGKARAQ